MDFERAVKLTQSYGKQVEYRVAAESHVFFRLIARQGEGWMMTATADEDGTPLKAYPDQARLIDETRRFLDRKGIAWEPKVDRNGKPYVEFLCPGFGEDSREIAAEILSALGIRSATKFLALAEMRAIYDDLAVEDGEDVYLSDGMYLTPQGTLRGKW